ncbi:hypothetical protein [Arthrobacter sedimenti]|uniref:hypothetical protein n=1 Tax=Arthrobacter sedimenti TaxID=2694931 RepID=UPI000B361E83|nr:hypothetical protein [Arthrobacter sedimenti]OUM41228.1 hypothetical protein B8W73_12915 [Arthrobacter agilis]
MIPNEPASSPSPEHPLQGPGGASVQPSRPGRALMVLAVVFAAIGLVSLAAILLTAFLQGPVWPGFVLATYFCLPIAFLLMGAAVVSSAISRRRS